jgi:small conductance mechanosensitive channel
MDELKTFLANAREEFPEFLALGTNIIAAIAILILGLWLARYARKKIRRSRFGGAHLDATLRPVLASILFYILLALTVYAALVRLGVPPTSLIAIFGAAGLAIGLALKDTLSNIASGIMLLSLRPIAVGEYIETTAAHGTVEEIGLFATTMKSPDGVYIYVPNSQIWANRIQNFGRHQSRKVIINIGIEYGSDLKLAKQELLNLLVTTPDVIHSPSPPEVYVTDFADYAVLLSCRCWLPADNWLERTSNLRMEIKSCLDNAAIKIATPQAFMRKIK